MKKIIAAAVATAFVAPAFAADVAVGGYFEYFFANEKDSNANSTQDIRGQESHFTVSASEALNNGMTVSADMTIESDGGDGGGASIALAGDFGKIELGDTSGGIDGIDDKGAIFIAYDMGNPGTSNDADMSWALPTLVEGMSVRLGYSAADSGTDTLSLADAQDSSGQGGTAKLVDAGVTYKVIDSVTLGVGTGSAGKVDYNLYNAVYSANGIRVAYEVGTVEDQSVAGTDDKTKGTQVALSYAFTGDTTLKYGTYKEEDEDAGTDNADITAYGVEYSLGAANLFLEVVEDNATGTDQDEMTAVGVNFSF